MEPSEYWRHEFESQRAESMHRSEVANTLGQSALKSMMLVNGGAILSLLTFVGNNGKVLSAFYLKVGMGLFGAGLFCALLAYFGAYFAQGDFMNVAAYRATDAQSKMINGDGIETPEIYEKRGTGLLWAAVALVMLSLLLFGGGVIASLSAII